MVYAKVFQPAFLLPEATRFPSTRYQGSKAKLADWIWGQIADLNFATCLGAFGGTGSVAYRFKQAGKAVTYNDILKFNYHFGAALIANSTARLEARDIKAVLCRHSHLRYPTFVQDNFHDVYFYALSTNGQSETEDMARAIDSTVPYRNLREYTKWRDPDQKLRSTDP
jgi:adenine-specific DNA-methyltransferase